MNVSLIIPALDEEEVIGLLLDEIPKRIVQEIIVVDNGSSDGTAEKARAHGAMVIKEKRKGYGYACMAGVREAKSEILVFMDGDGSDDPQDLNKILQPVINNEADLVSGIRVGKMLPHQRFGNKLAVFLIKLLCHVDIRDLAPLRSIKKTDLLDLKMEEMRFGWMVEMTIKAINGGLRIREVPVNSRKRKGGKSKVSGTIKGTLQAGYYMLSRILKYSNFFSIRKRCGVK